MPDTALFLPAAAFRGRRAAAAYGTAVNAGTAAYYTPAGYRAIRVIEIAKPAPDENGDSDSASAKADADSLAERIAAGEAIDALGVDAKELVVCETSTGLDETLRDSVMQLTEKGSVTPVTETATGFAIAEYMDDVAEHEATLDEVREALSAETLQNKKNEAYTAAVQAWIDASDVSMYLDRLN